MTETTWRNRAVGHDDIPPDKLVPNPRNWRVHPKRQQAALGDALDKVGWVRDIVVNTTTGHVIDGHLRVGLAVARGEPTVPVTYVQLDEAEEATVLASLDPLGELSIVDDAALQALLSDVEIEAGALADLLDGMTRLEDATQPPTQEQIDRRTAELGGHFAALDDQRQEDLADIECPECGHMFTVDAHKLTAASVPGS
ncbi:MAG TPA: hypothetical protein VKB55_14950 [Nocardioidaceae bacterium]|nr:hypothetical protein [Nocardioidaceae bacterium]